MSVVGYHGFCDSNADVTRAAYTITRLKTGRFNALDPTTDNLPGDLS